MTFCFAFKAPPDGIAVITDTRLSIAMGDAIKPIQGDYLKVFSPRKNCVIAIAGAINQLEILLNGVTSTIPLDDEYEFEFFMNTLRQRYHEMCIDGYLNSENPPSMSLIYGDLRHKHGTTKCRLTSFRFLIRDNKPCIERKIGDKVSYTSIGWTEEGRKILDANAINALQELESRSLVISEANESERKYFYKKAGYTPSEPSTLIRYDSSGKRDSSFRKELRRFSNNLDFNKKKDTKIHLEPMLVFGSAVQNELEGSMKEIREQNIPYHECIGTNWTLATLTRKHGFKIHSDKELKAALNAFRLN
jgi:hypothetical protein